MPRPFTKHASSEEWKPVTVIEMKKFFGLIFVTGIVRKLKLELYWWTRGIFQAPIFSQTMSRKRFQFIQRYLHFNDNNAAGTNHLYQENYYNSVHQTNELLQKLIRVCGTIKVNRGLLKDMVDEAKKLKKGEVNFRRNQEILLISHQDKKLINMISTLHTAEVMETTSRWTGVAKKKPKCIIDYNTHMHVLIQRTSIWLTTHSFVKLSSGPRKYFSLFSYVAFSTVMLPFQRIILIPAYHS